jgi:DDE family transposase
MRWVVERTFAWLSQFRRLRVHYEKRADIHDAFLSLGCALICLALFGCKNDPVKSCPGQAKFPRQVELR